MKKMLMVFVLILMSFGISQAADSVAIALYNVTDGVAVENGGTIYATTKSGDTILYRLEMSVLNEVNLGGISLGLIYSSNGDLNINWEPQTGGWDSTGQSDWAVVVPTCRLNPAQGGSGSFDMTGLLVTMRSIDSVAPDSMIMGGVSLFNSLAAGSLQKMFEHYFSLGTPTVEVTLEIDSGKIGGAGDFVLVNTSGGNRKPNFSGKLTFTVSTESGVGDNGPAVAYSYSLGQNFPNPFNPATKVPYTLARKSEVNVSVFNILGQKVKTLVNAEELPGPHEVIWNGDDDGGNKVASGIYFYKIVTADYIATRKMVLMH